MSIKEKNPVLYVLHGIEVRKENKITIRCSEGEFTRLIKIHVDTGRNLSLPKILSLLSGSCQKCGHDSVDISFKKNVLSTNRSFSGGNITTQNHSDVK